MRVTIDIPDAATKLLYVECDENGWESEPKPVTMGMFVGVEREDSDARSPEH